MSKIMTNDPAHTPRRTLRVDEATWIEFGLACQFKGETRSEAIRGLMRRYISRAKRQQKGATE